MASKTFAAIDGVLLKVGDRITSLYKDAVVPADADAEHVKVLTDRGLLVEQDVAEPSEADDVDGDGPIPAKSANKDVWVAYAVSKGATQEEAEASNKDDLIAAYGAG